MTYDNDPVTHGDLKGYNTAINALERGLNAAIKRIAVLEAGTKQADSRCRRCVGEGHYWDGYYDRDTECGECNGTGVA